MKTIRIKFVDFTSSPGSLRNIKALISQFYELDETDIAKGFELTEIRSNLGSCATLVWQMLLAEGYDANKNKKVATLAFEHIELGDRYLRLPLWLLYRNDIERLKVKHIHTQLKDKDSFCSFVYSNSNAAPEREQLFDLLSAYRTVSSGGRYRNNVGEPVADKLAFQQHHKFDIAFENTSHDGYTTEKLVQAFAAGTVPIYWGDPRVGETFNTDSFINCHDYPNFDAVVERVKEIDGDDALWQKMISTPALRDPETVDKSMAELNAFLRHIFDQEPQAARRFSRDYWALKQLHQRQRERRAYERSFRGRMQTFTNRYIFPFARKHEKLWLAFKSLAKKLNM